MLTRGRQGAFLFGAVASTLILLCSPSYLGPVGLLLTLLTPAPAAYVHMRLGAWGGLLVILLSASALLGWGVDGIKTVLLYLFQFGFPSFLLPFLLRRRIAWDRAVAGATLGILAVSLLFMVGSAVYLGQSFTAEVGAYVQAELKQAMAVYQQAGLTPEQLEELRKLTTRTAEFMTMAYPGILTIAIGGLLLLIVLILARLARGDYLLDGPSPAQWKAPEVLIWPAILGGFGVFFAAGLYFQIAVNLLTIALPIYFLQGLAVVAHFFQRRGVPAALRMLGYLLLVIVNPLPAIIAGIGIFDIWVDFRNPKIKKS